MVFVSQKPRSENGRFHAVIEHCRGEPGLACSVVDLALLNSLLSPSGAGDTATDLKQGGTIYNIVTDQMPCPVGFILAEILVRSYW